nr:hypothetical protein BaRGS_027471 [Batillaria attramentaria]
MSQASTKIIGSEKAATGRRPTLPSIPPTSELSTPLAGLKRNTSARIPVMAFLLQTTFEQTGDRKDKSKTTLFNEGEESVEEEKNHFMGSIQRTLREATDGLLTTAETCAVEHAKTLLDALPRLAEQQLVQYDGLLVVDDVEKGRMPLNQLVAENRPSKLQLTPTVQTSKTTLGHSSTVKARDSAYEDYKVQFENTLAMIEEEKERLVRDEEHWTNSWLTSVQRVKDLHQPQ